MQYRIGVLGTSTSRFVPVCIATLTTVTQISSRYCISLPLPPTSREERQRLTVSIGSTCATDAVTSQIHHSKVSKPQARRVHTSSNSPGRLPTISQTYQPSNFGWNKKLNHGQRYKWCWTDNGSTQSRG